MFYEDFKAIVPTLKDYQEEALKKMAEHSIGQFILPTGTGKTWPECLGIVRDMIAKDATGTKGLFVLATPRLALGPQILEQLVRMSKLFKAEFDVVLNGTFQSSCDYLKVSSKNMEIFNINIENKESAVASFVEKILRGRNRHCVIMTTYQSLDNLSNIENDIDIFIADEAHFICEKEKNNKIFFNQNKHGKTLFERCKKIFFFTATRRVSEDIGENDDDEEENSVELITEGLMDSEAKFGPVLMYMSPREARKRNLIASFNYHEVDSAQTVNGKCDSAHNIAESMIEAYKDNEKNLTKYYSENLSSIKVSSKLITRHRGSAEILNVSKSQNLVSFCKEKSIHLISLTSQFGCSVNGVDVPQEHCMKIVRTLEDETPAIILQHDILTTGFDLPNLTACMIFGTMPKISCCQFIGRVVRPHPSDRSKNAEDIKKLTIKPFCDLYIPKYLSNNDEEYQNVVNMFDYVLGELVELPVYEQDMCNATNTPRPEEAETTSGPSGKSKNIDNFKITRMGSFLERRRRLEMARKEINNFNDRIKMWKNA